MTDRNDDAFRNIAESMMAESEEGTDGENGRPSLPKIFAVSFLSAVAAFFFWSILISFGIYVGFNEAVDIGWIDAPGLGFTNAWGIGIGVLLVFVGIRQGTR